MFGFARKTEDTSAAVVIKAAPLIAPAVSDHAVRRDLLQQISNFLLDHQLDVNPANLALAQAAFSGRDARLSHRIIARQQANEPVTQAWLDDLARAGDEQQHAAEPDGRDERNWLIGKLDDSLEQFLRNASEASSTVADYHVALFETASSLAEPRSAAEVAQLAQLTRTMIERTRLVEQEMRQRQGEAASLRQSLQLARADAAIDHLTGLDNRREFEVVLDREYRAARAAGEPLSIAFCDIDRFKLINDSHGHDTGDRVIQAIARVLQRVSGQHCHVARHGGEEFALLFRGLTPEQARRELDDARESFAQRKLVDRKTHKSLGTVTFSGGVAECPRLWRPARGAEGRRPGAARGQGAWPQPHHGRGQHLIAPVSPGRPG